MTRCEFQIRNHANHRSLQDITFQSPSTRANQCFILQMRPTKTNLSYIIDTQQPSHYAGNVMSSTLLEQKTFPGGNYTYWIKDAAEYCELTSNIFFHKHEM